ncbi:MAG: hypothetical protein ABIZ80_08995 [Bryobacteraceae bacterium]
MKIALVLLGILLVCGTFRSSNRPNLPPGTLAADEPSQSITPGRSWEHAGHQITALARFRVRALVLSTERYWTDPASSLSPVDLVLGWGPMSDPATVRQFRFSQGARWFHMRPIDRLQLPIAYLQNHCSNMHMIPADGRISSQLKSISSWDVVDISGYLVEASRERFRIRSSLSRTDTGGGACEVVWVEEVSTRGQ